MSSTQVYVNWGRLVADCSKDWCTDAVQVEVGQDTAACVAGHRSTLVWDKHLPAVLAELGERAEERRRNWFPAGHPLAVLTGQPHGQSVADLRGEHVEGVTADERARAGRREKVQAALAGLGVELLPDGTLRGDI